MARARESKTSVRRLNALAKGEQALEMRKAGLSFPEIARAIGYKSPSGAYEAVESAIQRLIKEPAEAVIEMELARLDAMLGSVWPAVLQGDTGAHAAAMHILARRSRYLGLDAPAKIAHTADDGTPIPIIVYRAPRLLPAPDERDNPQS